MKFLLFLIGFLAFFNCQAQRTKSFEVLNITAVVKVLGVVHYGETSSDTGYCVLGRDSRFTHIIDFDTIFKGSINDCIGFVKYSISLMDKEDAGVSEIYKGTRIEVSATTFGELKYVKVYSSKKPQMYTSLDPQKLKAMSKKLQSFVAEQNIKIN